MHTRTKRVSVWDLANKMTLEIVDITLELKCLISLSGLRLTVLSSAVSV